MSSASFYYFYFTKDYIITKFLTNIIEEKKLKFEEVTPFNMFNFPVYKKIYKYGYFINQSRPNEFILLSSSSHLKSLYTI